MKLETQLQRSFVFLVAMFSCDLFWVGILKMSRSSFPKLGVLPTFLPHKKHFFRLRLKSCLPGLIQWIQYPNVDHQSRQSKGSLQRKDGAKYLANMGCRCELATESTMLGFWRPPEP